MKEKTLNLIAQAIYDKKGCNILGLDLRGISSLTDYLLIGEGNVERHVIAIAREIIRVMEEAGEKPLHIEGLSTGDWVVLDFGDIIVHLFKPGLRELYRLDQLWKEGTLLNLNIQTANTL